MYEIRLYLQIQKRFTGYLRVVCHTSTAHTVIASSCYLSSASCPVAVKPVIGVSWIRVWIVRTKVVASSCILNECINQYQPAFEFAIGKWVRIGDTIMYKTTLIYVSYIRAMRLARNINNNLYYSRSCTSDLRAYNPRLYGKKIECKIL